MLANFQYAIGWDVGAWHCDKGRSRDTVCVLRHNGTGAVEPVGDVQRGNLRDVINGPGGPNLVYRLLEWKGLPVGDRDADITIAIDTPLGWPKAFTDLLKGKSLEDEIPERKARNPLLLRETERLLWKQGPSEPLSAVQDMIGSQSTKGLQFLHRAGFQRQRKGNWSLDLEPGRKATAIETYPSPAKIAPMVQRIFSKLRWSALPEKLPASAISDSEDALLCAIVAFLYDRQLQDLEAPKEDPPQGEGWIWLPSMARPRKKKPLRNKEANA